MNRNLRIIAAIVAAGLVALVVGLIVSHKTPDAGPLDPATGDTTGIAGTLPDVTVPTAPARWSDTADADFASVRSAFSGGGSVADVATLFGVPVAVPQPADAVLDHARYSVVANEAGGAEESWSIWSTSASTVADAEAAFTSGFTSDAFTPGARSENEFAGLASVTLNYTPTGSGQEAGWVNLTATIGADSDGLEPNGRSYVRVDLTRVLVGVPELSQMPSFAAGWLSEVPVADGVTLAELSAEAGKQPFDRVWMNARFTAPQDQFPALISFYGNEHSDSALAWPQSVMPEGIDELEYFQHSEAVTLADHPVTVAADRYLPEPDFPAAVNIGVKLEAAG